MLIWNRNCVSENDPVSFVLKSPNGATLLTITGLDEVSESADVSHDTFLNILNLIWK